MRVVRLVPGHGIDEVGAAVVADDERSGDGQCRAGHAPEQSKQLCGDPRHGSSIADGLIGHHGRCTSPRTRARCSR
jgi:hypothetical protein